MNKIIYLIFFSFFCSVISYSALLEGHIKGKENYGVFVFIENNGKYDISDANGNFKIDDLEEGKKYKLIFQKDNIPDHTESISINSSKVLLDVELGKKKINYLKIKGIINSDLKNDILIKFDKKYGKVVKANQVFYLTLREGKYNAKLIQEGAFSKDIKFNVSEENKNMGTYKMEEFPKNNLEVLFEDEKVDGKIFLYKNKDLVFSEDIEKSSKIKIENLLKGNYRLNLKLYGKKDYEEEIEIDGDRTINVKTKKLSKYDNIYLKIFPSDVEIELKLYQNGDLIKEVKEKGLLILENLDYDKNYDIKISSKKYKVYELNSLKAGDSKEIGLIRDIKGTFISGTVYPFNAEAEVMLLDNDYILSKVKTDENGYYELEADNLSKGRKTIRVKAEGFREYKEMLSIDKTSILENKNIELQAVKNQISGKVFLNSGKDNKNILVIVEELKIWEHTNEDGEFYFNNLDKGTYNLIFKKLGYETKVVKLNLEEKNLEINEELKPVAKIILRAEEAPYKIYINDEKMEIENLYQELKLNLGNKLIKAEKENYVNYMDEIYLSEAGEIRDVNIKFIKKEDYKKNIEATEEKLQKALNNFDIKKAETYYFELKEKDYANLHPDKIKKYELEMQKGKKNLFDLDRKTYEELEYLKKRMNAVEEKDLSYNVKKRRLDEIYKESLDYTEKILKNNPYSNLKYDIYVLQSEIYEKMGMMNSAENALKEAENYK